MDILLTGLLAGLSFCILYLLRLSRRRVLRQGSKIEGRLGHVGMPHRASELVQLFIEQIGLKHWVKVTKGADYDAYDSDTSTIKLEDNTAESYALVHGFIACHELGHAIIDHRSRLLKFVCDNSVYAMNRKVTPWLAGISIVSTAAGWSTLATLSLLSIALQLAAALVVQAVEHGANRYALLLITGGFDVEDDWMKGLRNCAYYSLATHAHDVARPAALLLILGQLTAWGTSLVMLAPALALIYFVFSVVAVWIIARK